MNVCMCLLYVRRCVYMCMYILCMCFFLYIRGVAIKKPDSCSNPLLKNSESRNIISSNVVPSCIPTLLHAYIPLLEAVLQVILC